jgi:hypothetical protein
LSELKCCELCGAFYTCKDKKECCPECENFDPVESSCLAIFEKKKAASRRVQARIEDEDVDPDTFLFEDDEDVEEESVGSDALDDDIGFDDDDDW